MAPGVDESVSKIPKAAPQGSRFDRRMTWCRTRADVEGAWSWGEPRQWTDDEWTSTIHCDLSYLSASTWGEIDQMSSGSAHKMHHAHELVDLVEEAQDRWIERDLEQFDSVFRFRIGGQKRRAWGFIVQAHFHLVWWEREHNIYPVE